MEKAMSIFNTLNAINVNEHTEKKNNLTYLSWAWAWAEVKKNYPNAFYTIYEDANGCFYHTDGKTAWVKTGVTIDGLEHIEYLPVMDYKNASIPMANIASVAVNKAIQRSLTKACARHGLGLYIYAGEDLPEEEAKTKQEQTKQVADPIHRAELMKIIAAGYASAEKVAAAYNIDRVVNISADDCKDALTKAYKAMKKMNIEWDYIDL